MQRAQGAGHREGGRGLRAGSKGRDPLLGGAGVG